MDTQLTEMCAFKHESNELLHSFHEHCVHLTILFQGLNDDQHLHATNGCNILVRVAMIAQINELFVGVYGKRKKVCKKVECMNTHAY